MEGLVTLIACAAISQPDCLLSESRRKGHAPTPLQPVQSISLDDIVKLTLLDMTESSIVKIQGKTLLLTQETSIETMADNHQPDMLGEVVEKEKMQRMFMAS